MLQHVAQDTEEACAGAINGVQFFLSFFGVLLSVYYYVLLLVVVVDFSPGCAKTKTLFAGWNKVSITFPLVNSRTTCMCEYANAAVNSTRTCRFSTMPTYTYEYLDFRLPVL